MNGTYAVTIIFFFKEFAMATNALAKSVFVRNPDEATLVADVYKTTTTTPVNSFQDITNTGFELEDKYSFLSSVTSEKILHAAAGDVAVDKESLTDKISSAFSGDYSKAKSLISSALSGSKAAIAEIKSKTNSVTGMLKQAQSVYATVNGVVSTIKTGNLKNLKGISDAINSISGKVGVSLSANGALSGIFTSLVGEAGTAGIKDSFGIVATSIKDATNITDKSKLIYQVATGSLPAAVKRGDLRSITSMVDNIGTGSVSMLQPDILKVLSKTNTDKFTPTEIGGVNGQFVAYQGAYQKIDPNWNTSTWKPAGNNAPMKDLSCLLDASKETREIFTIGAKLSDDPSTNYLAMLEKMPSSVSVDAEIAKRYPMSPAAVVINSISKDTDPLLYGINIE